MREFHRFASVWALAAVAIIGCGESGPSLYPVSGTVTLNEKPLENATVTFVPDPSNTNVTPGADHTGPDGNFKPRYNGRFGLAPGKYKVIINKKSEPPPGVSLPKGIDVDPIQQGLMGIRKETLPKQYSDVANSTEVVEVKAEGENIFEFDVKVASKK